MSHYDLEAVSLTVRLGALAENYRVMRRLAGSDVAAVVKADGYGLGAAMAAPALAGAGCGSFFVARLQEGIALRPLLPKARIFVLDGASGDAAGALAAHNLIPVLNSLEDIASYVAAARRRKLDAAIHFDTGMNRLGLSPEELALLAAEWKKRTGGLNVVLLMSHLACSDQKANKMNAVQLTRFRAGLAMLPPAPASLAASGGVLLGREYRFDLARTGLGLYGGNPQIRGKNPFKPVAFLNARVIQTRKIAAGETVGYGATFRAKKASLLATVALGYADGIARALSNRGMAYVGGKRVKLVGRISMDLAGLDITGVKGVKPGDDIEFLGKHISLEDVAGLAGTNSYEVLTGLAHAPHSYSDGA